MKSIAATILSALALAHATPFFKKARQAPGQPVPPFAPPPGSVKINYVSYSGSGCPQGSVTQYISDDQTLMTVGFDNFSAFIGPQASPADRAKNCQLHLGLTYPGGYQFSVVNANYHGFTRLDAGVSASMWDSYYFSQSAAKTWTTVSTIYGPTSDIGTPFLKTDQVPTASVVWSPCNSNGLLNINQQIALSAKNRTVSGEFSAADATVQFQLQTFFAWQACGTSTPSAVVANTIPTAGTNIVTTGGGTTSNNVFARGEEMLETEQL